MVRSALGLLAAGAWLLVAWPARAAQHRETLIYSKFDIDPGEWRYFEFPSKQKDARLQVEFKVESPQDSSGVRATVLTAEDYRRLRAHQPHREIGSSAYRREATLRTRLAEPGGYVVLIDNRLEGRRKCRVEMEASLITGPDPETLPVDYASNRKRFIVVTISLTGFLAILILSGQALWRATRRQPGVRGQKSGVRMTFWWLAV